MERFAHRSFKTTRYRRFEEFRHAVHRTCFEQAQDLATGAVVRDGDQPLVLAYAAIVARLLYHDPQEEVGRAAGLIADRTDAEMNLITALLAFAERRLEDCEVRLRSFLQDHAQDPYARHVLGFTLIDLGRVEEAVTLLESLVSDRPDFTPALNHLGAGYLALGDVDRGVEALRRFVERDPGNPSAHDSLADGLTAAGDDEGAIAEIIRAVLTEPRFAYAWLHLGEIFERRSENDLARAAYTTARRSAESYDPGFFMLLDAKSLER